MPGVKRIPNEDLEHTLRCEFDGVVEVDPDVLRELLAWRRAYDQVLCSSLFHWMTDDWVNDWIAACDDVRSTPPNEGAVALRIDQADGGVLELRNVLEEVRQRRLAEKYVLKLLETENDSHRREGSSDTG